MNEKSKNTSRQWVGPLAFFLLIIAVGMAAYHFRGYFEPKVIATLTPDTSCDLRKSPCKLSLPGGGEIQFSITPQTIPVLEPVQFHVQVKGKDVSAVEVDLVGIGMNMGYNRPALKPEADGSFSGETMIPVCIRKRMDWEARVLLHTPAGIVMAPFRFFTIKK